MKLLFLFTALLLAATAHSEEVNDTAFNVKDKKNCRRCPKPQNYRNGVQPRRL